VTVGASYWDFGQTTDGQVRDGEDHSVPTGRLDHHVVLAQVAAAASRAAHGRRSIDRETTAMTTAPAAPRRWHKKVWEE
jgi:hypothetical protein